MQANTLIRFLLLSLIVISCNSIAIAASAGTGDSGQLARFDLCRLFNAQVNESKYHPEININFAKPKKFFRNILAAKIFSIKIQKTTGFSRLVLADQFKVWFGGRLSFLGTDGKLCRYKIKLRLTGDFMDHISFDKGMAFSSYVKVKDGSIGGLVGMKLFVPQARNGGWEIFGTTIAKMLGFLAPETIFANVNMLGQSHRYLIQEDIDKEFIERNSRYESPTLEGDDRLKMAWYKGGEGIYADIRYALGRLTNAKWANKSSSNLQVSFDALNLLNLAYIEFLERTKNINVTDYYPRLDLSMLSGGDEIALTLWREYEAFVDVVSSGHALIPSNQQFYYDRIARTLEPILYDGNLYSKGKWESDNIPSHFRNSSILGAKTLIIRISKISAEELWSELDNKNSTLSLNDVRDTLDLIKNNISLLSKQNISNVKKVKTDRDEGYKHFGNYPDNYNKNKRLVYLASNGDLLSCYPLKVDCSIIDLKDTEIIKLISGRLYIDGKYLVYVGLWEDGVAKTEGKRDKAQSQKYAIAENIVLIPSGNPKISIDKERKEITVVTHNKRASALITGRGEMNGWSIQYSYMAQPDGPHDENILNRMQVEGTTGCLTLRNLTVSGLAITVNGCHLEDGVNFIRTTGSIKSIKINNALNDGIDSDFSKLNIDKIEVKDAGNDCLDLSYGTYIVNEIIADTCHDKSISVGENSVLNVDSAYLKNSFIGVASKDGSVVNIKNLTGSKLNQCYATYNKKPEFGLGALYITGEFNCEGNS